MKYIVDIDGTICKTSGDAYGNSVPLLDRIELINKLYDQGHEIHYWTARGSRSGKDWKDFTIKQLVGWGCKYNSINVGKPVYDMWIDDKAINSESFFNDTSSS